MKTLLLVFGTRPEAVKMCPLALELKKDSRFRVRICVTGQHRQLLDGAMAAFGVKADVDLGIMHPGQDLFDITSAVLGGMEQVLEAEKPHLVLVHGDTSTSFAAALACFYKKIPVAHVEAGLRSGDLQAPYPEEFNRRSVDMLSRWLFAPTEKCRQNLLAEGRGPEDIYVTGNTAIDALAYTVRKDYRHPLLDWAEGSRLVLLTAHRRENLGAPMERIYRAVRRIADSFEDVKILYPRHPNPALQGQAERVFAGCGSIRICEPLDTADFHNFLSRAYLVLTDSGGLQEEAPALGKPVVVLREVTERPEGVEAGTLLLAGTEEEAVFAACRRLLEDGNDYNRMSNSKNPYGDGKASERIAKTLIENLL